MNDKKFENQPTKRIWIQPAVAVIDLRSAHHGKPSTISDNGNNNRRS